MSQVIAAIDLVPDPGWRTVIASFHCWFPITSATQEMNVSVKQNGTPLATARWSVGDPVNFRVDLVAPVIIGPQSANVRYSAEIDWGAGGGGQAVTFADPAYNRLSVVSMRYA